MGKSVIVVGAGMAGHQAAKTLRDAGIDVQIVEAQKQTGGRTKTNRDFAGIPIETGAEFVHGTTRATGALVKKLGLKTIPWYKTTDTFIELNSGDPLQSLDQARKQNPEFDQVRAWNFPRPAFLPEGETFASYLRRAQLNEDQIHYFRRAYGNVLGEDPEQIDAEQAITEADTYAGEDLKMVEGYDTLLSHILGSIPVHLNEPIESIYWKDHVELKSASGKIFSADAVILTIPTGVLKSNRIQFCPGMPDKKRQALEKLTMAPFVKTIFKFEENPLKDGVFAIYSAGNPPTWWKASAGHPNKHVWTAFFSGRWAREMLCHPQDEILGIALNTFRKTIGAGKIEASGIVVNWLGNPYTMGGYTACLPGGGFQARHTMAEPTPPLFWAGEGHWRLRDSSHRLRLRNPSSQGSHYLPRRKIKILCRGSSAVEQRVDIA